MADRAPFLKTLKHTLTGGHIADHFPIAGNFIAVLSLEGRMEIDFHDGRKIELLQGFKINFSEVNEFGAFTLRRVDGDAAVTPVSIWMVYGWEPRRAEDKPLFEDNRAIFDIGALSVNIAEQFASNLPTWTRLLPRVSGGVEAPGLGNLHALSNSVAVQVAVRNPAALRRIIRIRRGWVNKEVYNISLNVGSPGALTMLLVSPVATGTEKWAPASLRDVVIEGGDPIWLTAWADFGEQGPWEGIRIEEVYRAKVPLA